MSVLEGIFKVLEILAWGTMGVLTAALFIDIFKGTRFTQEVWWAAGWVFIGVTFIGNTLFDHEWLVAGLWAVLLVLYVFILDRNIKRRQFRNWQKVDLK